MNYRRTGFTASSVTYSNPVDFADTAKASVDRKNKVIGPAQLTNVSTQIKLNRRALVPDPSQGECCTVPRYEDLSMQFLSSGSVENYAQLLQMKVDMVYLINLWFNDIAHGFVPLEVVPALPATP